MIDYWMLAYWTFIVYIRNDIQFPLVYTHRITVNVYGLFYRIAWLLHQQLYKVRVFVRTTHHTMVYESDCLPNNINISVSYTPTETNSSFGYIILHLYKFLLMKKKKIAQLVPPTFPTEKKNIAWHQLDRNSIL